MRFDKFDRFDRFDGFERFERFVMATLKKFEEILAWQEARALAKMVYDITRKGALSKDFDNVSKSGMRLNANA